MDQISERNCGPSSSSISSSWVLTDLKSIRTSWTSQPLSRISTFWWWFWQFFLQNPQIWWFWPFKMPRFWSLCRGGSGGEEVDPGRCRRTEGPSLPGSGFEIIVTADHFRNLKPKVFGSLILRWTVFFSLRLGLVEYFEVRSEHDMTYKWRYCGSYSKDGIFK